MTPPSMVMSRNASLQGLRNVRDIPLGNVHDSPVGTLTMDLDGMVTVSELWVSYPIDPLVARDGRVAFSDRSWNGT